MHEVVAPATQSGSRGGRIEHGVGLNQFIDVKQGQHWKLLATFAPPLFLTPLSPTPRIPFPGTLYPLCTRCNQRGPRPRYPPCNANRRRPPPATIVIPAWNAWDAHERCLRSPFGRPWVRDRVVVVDNGSTDGPTRRFAGPPWLEVLANDQNQGFARLQPGRDEAREGVIVFLNSDTVVPLGWLDELLAPRLWRRRRRRPRFGQRLGPPARRWPFPIPTWSPTPSLVPAAWRTTHSGQTSETRRLIGFCLAVRASPSTSLAASTSESAIGGFEDDDLCRRLQQRDLRLLIAHASFVHHHGHASFDSNAIDWRVTQDENRLRFEEKWGPDALRRPTVLSALPDRQGRRADARRLPGVGADAVDEIVVYDTGSSDRTMQIARDAGAAVVEGEWRDSFAAPGTRHWLTPPVSGCSPSMLTSGSRPILMPCEPSFPIP